MACTDDSEQVVRSFADPRVRWHNLPANSGSQAGPNAVALDLARRLHRLPRSRRCLAADPRRLADGRRDTNGLTACAHAHRMDRARRQIPGIPVLPISSYLAETELGRAPSAGETTARSSSAPTTTSFGRADERRGRLRFTHSPCSNFPRLVVRTVTIEKPSDQQAAYVHRIESERGFIYRELAALGIARMRRRQPPRRLRSHRVRSHLAGASPSIEKLAGSSRTTGRFRSARAE